VLIVCAPRSQSYGSLQTKRIMDAILLSQVSECV